MGWYGTYDTTMGAMIRERIAPQKSADGSTTWETVKHCIKGMNLWTVIEIKKDGELTDRIIVLYLLRRGRNGEWCYKDVSDSMGPAEVNCPLSYLDGLSEPESYAAEWRQRVRDYHAEQTRKRDHARSLKIGDKVQVYGKEFTITGKAPKRFRGQWHAIDPTGFRYRIRANQIEVPA